MLGSCPWTKVMPIGGVDMHIGRIEDITGVTGASTTSSIYNSIQMAAFTNPGIHLR